MELSTKEKQYYARQIQLNSFGLEAQLQLKAASVLVIGAGGLGCPCLLYLNAAGVGHLGIIDDDVVSLSNLHRQTLYNEKDIGLLKAATAKQKLAKNNSNTAFTIFIQRLNEENALSTIAKFDVVIDASDNFATRYLVNTACLQLNKPLVYAALFKFEGHITTFNYKNGPNLNDLFPENANDNEIANCANAGVLGVLPGILGTWQALEAIKIITGLGEVLSGKLLLFNCLDNKTDTILFNKQTTEGKQSAISESVLNQDVNEIDFEVFTNLNNKNAIQIIDVRDEYEFDECNLGGRNIPLIFLEKQLNIINPAIKTVVICQSGLRSKKAIDIIKTQFPAIDIYQLKGGIQSANFEDY